LPAAKRCGAALLLVGDGPQRQELEEQCRRLEISDSVRFAGNVDYDQIYQYYALADAFIIPTLEDNWSLVVPEAMACGLPILCSVFNGCWPEMVKPENGWTFDPTQKEAFSKTLAECLDKRQQLPSMGRASQELVSAYSPRKAAEGILEACKIALRKA
ncbi:MAG: glycosyltransferase, partial [Porticoccaceae bacterium]|nr:glycosyltransferase [Porticoccaceae bacterium]